MIRSACIVVLAMAGTAHAFASAPPPSPHGEITRDAAAAAGWPGDAIEVLVVRVLAPDVNEMEIEPKGRLTRIDTKPSYQPWHHCDRVMEGPASDDATALRMTIDHIQAMRLQALEAQDAKGFVNATGYGLHALQDCFSHSDFVDLDPQQQDAFVTALLGRGEPPDVRLVATAPGTDRPGHPDDPYPHDEYAKDSADQNEEAKAMVEGRSKYEIARHAATVASARYLQEFVDGMDASMRQDIAAMRVDAPESNPIPGLPFVWILAALRLPRRAR